MHGVSAARIPEVVPREFGVSVADCADLEALLPKLSEELLDWIVDFFGIQREWLAGEDEPIYDTFHCYKHTEYFIKKAVELLGRTRHIELGIFLDMDPQRLKWRGRGESVLVFQEEVHELPNRDVYRYHVCYSAHRNGAGSAHVD